MRELNSSKNNDTMILLGALLCIALGGSVTFWLTHKSGMAKTETVTHANSEPGGFTRLTFDTLASFYYEIPRVDPLTNKPVKQQIPHTIRALSGKAISLEGFMLPIDLKRNNATRFLLLRDQSLCCQGRTPRINEWVSVKMKPGKTARVIQDQPVTVFGTIEVGEQVENGEVLNIYRIDADDVAGPLDL